MQAKVQPASIGIQPIALRHFDSEGNSPNDRIGLQMQCVLYQTK